MADYHGRRRVGWKELWHFDAFLFFLAFFVLRVRELRSLALDVSVGNSALNSSVKLDRVIVGCKDGYTSGRIDCESDEESWQDFVAGVAIDLAARGMT